MRSKGQFPIMHCVKRDLPFAESSIDQATEGGIVKVGGTLPDKVVLVNFGALIPNIVVIPKGVAAFSLYFSFKPRFDENRTISLLY